ncbi:MAG: CCA tRNA nucleotidyltransferase, partial [Acidobacteriota bacterium]
MDRDEKLIVGIDFIPGDVREVMERLVRSGFGVWLVGGAVRDYLRGEAPKDWDLATDATPDEVTFIFKRVVPVGLRHGTIQVHTKERDIEVTSCPAKGREGIFRDLARRDFTVNAMALSYPEGELLDLFQGREDLDRRVLRGVADPGARFREDPLRTIRAFRFVSSYGFEVDPDTLSAAGEEAKGLEGVARERIREEMLRLIGGENVVSAMELMRESGVLPVVLPELVDGIGVRQEDHYRLDVFEHTIHAVQISAPRTLVRMAALFHCIGKPVAEREGGTATMESMRTAEAVLQRWLAPPRRIRDVVLLLE